MNIRSEFIDIFPLTISLEVLIRTGIIPQKSMEIFLICTLVKKNIDKGISYTKSTEIAGTKYLKTPRQIRNIWACNKSILSMLRQT